MFIACVKIYAAFYFEPRIWRRFAAPSISAGSESGKPPAALLTAPAPVPFGRQEIFRLFKAGKTSLTQAVAYHQLGIIHAARFQVFKLKLFQL